MWWRLSLIFTVLLTGCVPSQPVVAPQPEVAVAAPAISPLAVTAVVPEPGASAVLFNSAVFVQFNRPVVPLTTLAHPVTELPLKFEPPIPGSGHWINTGLFTFTPEVGWAPSTTYHVATENGSYAWSFSTSPPAVAFTVPAASANLVDPASPLRVTFNQPVEPTSVELTLTPSVGGEVEWPDNRTLVVHVEPPFAAGAQYEAQVQLVGGATPYTWRFETAPEPSITRSVPAPGMEAPKLGQVELFFSAPMDADDVRANLAVEPELDYMPHPHWSDNDTHATVYGAFKPEKQYTLTLAAGTHDRFGRAMKDAFTLNFRTPASQNSPTAPPVTPQAWLVSPFLGGTLDAYARPRVLLRTTNVSHFEYSVDAVDEATAVGGFAWAPADRIRDGRHVLGGGVDVQSERNVPVLSGIDLGQLPPGYYRLRIEPMQTAARVPDHLLVITRTMLAVKQSNTQLLVWATDLKSGEPLSNLPVRVLRSDARGPVAQGVTDADGTLQVDLAPGGQTQIVVVADRPEDATLAMSNWTAGVGAWGFGLPVNYSTSPLPQYTGHVYTDRPVYRPGQTVHLKGIVRRDDDAAYSLPPDSFSATWQVRDSQGRAISSGSVNQLSEFGTFDVDAELSSEAVTGTYTFDLQTSAATGALGDPPSATSRGQVNDTLAKRPLASATFVVADYQRPDFEVSLDAPKEVVAGQQLAASVRSAYYFGQPLARADVHWQVTAQPFAFSWASDPTLRFGESDARMPKRVTTATNAARTEGKGTTSDAGGITLHVPTPLAQDEESQRFTIEATVTDDSRSEVSNRTSVVVHKAGLYLGLKPTTFVGQAAQPQGVEVIALDIQGQARPGVNIHGQVLRRRWKSVRERDAQGELHWVSRPDDTPVSEFDAQSGADGRGSFSFTPAPAEGGEYRLIVEAPDDSGNVARSAISVWVAGAGFVPWRINDDGRLELQVDKPQYQPGDVAHVIIPAPVANATALIAVERGKLISHAVQVLAGNSTVLDIPIGLQHIPNAYVSVLLFSGGQSPTLWTGYVELSVSSATRQLQVTAEPDRREHAPGETVTYTVHTRDGSGQGVAAEVSLALVDAAVLALVDAHADPVMAFWHRRPLGVRSGSSLGVSIDRMNEAASSGRKGGGGGDSATTRDDFPDTAFWAPAIRTDASGVAHVNVHLPDTLTTWRLSAVAVTQDTRVGVASSEVVTGKPLLIRPLAPRFLVGGDVVTVGASVHNTTALPLSVTASLRADGLAVQGDERRPIEVPAGGQVHLEWPVSSSVGQTRTATLHFVAGGDSHPFSDAVDVRVPLLAWGASTTVATAGEVGPAETTAETVDVPKEVDPQRGELTVEVAPSLAAALRYSLRQVEEYPYECLEQTVSRFLPRLALDRAINSLGLADPLNLKTDLPGLVTRSIQRVYKYQHGDGGWGWWSNDSSNPYLTAYALAGLLEARKDGFAVEQDVSNRAATFLRQWLNGDPGVYGIETRAYVLYVLGEAGMPDPSRAATLFDRRADLLPLGKAYLAQSLARIDPNDSRVGGLLAELTNAAVVSATGSHWEESNTPVKYWIMASDVRTTAAVLDALIRLRPDHPLIPSAVRWLMDSRRDEHGSWETTHDAAQSLLTLTDYLSMSGELRGNFTWQLGVNGQTRQNGTVDQATVASAPTQVVVPMPLLKVGQNPVELIRSVGPGRLYYSLQLRSFDHSAEMAFISHGFTVGREYLRFGSGVTRDEPVREVHVGDLIQVRLTVIAPAALRALVVEDPLPAGLEPIDTRLKTTSQAVASAVQAARAPGWQPWTHLDVRSDRVTLFANYVERGVFQYTYVARASLAGDYHVLPVNGREQYFPDVFARGDGQHFTVLP